MKKTVLIFLVSLFAAGVVFSGCSSREPTPPAETTAYITITTALAENPSYLLPGEDILDFWERRPEFAQTAENRVPFDSDLDAFLDSELLTEQENEDVKKIVLNIIRCIFNEGVELNDVLPLIDAEAIIHSYNNGVHTVLDEMNSLREVFISRGDETLNSIYMNFMWWFGRNEENDTYSALVSFYSSERRYNLHFKFMRIDGEFRVVSLGFG